MAISDKTRKILWGRSGSRCAICRNPLVVDATSADDESVVGDECHVKSPRPKGPRHDPSYPPDRLDDYENLILLCRVHHKMVDDQAETYTVHILRQFKANREAWVVEKLNCGAEPKPLRLRKTKEGTPAYLARLKTGQEVLDVVNGACAGSMTHDELTSGQEVELVGGFLQDASDWGEMGDVLEPIERVRAAYSLTQSLQELEQAGFWVFGGREIQVIEGGVGGPSSWPIAILRVVRNTNRTIMEIGREKKG